MIDIQDSAVFFINFAVINIDNRIIIYIFVNGYIIKDNRFENMYTADDFVTIHSLNANFICVRGDSALISGNHIENLYGFGQNGIYFV